MNNNNIIELMEKYNLDLRRIGEKHVTYHAIGGDSYQLKVNERIVETAVAKMSKEDYDKREKEGYCTDSRWQNGYKIRKWVEETHYHRKPGWLATNMDTTEEHQSWAQAFYGETPEEAINKAIEYIERGRKEWDDMQKEAGLI